MGLSIILERPSESITAKDERLAKRLKNHGDREVENLDQVDVEEIEADGVDGEVGKMDSKVQDGTDQQGHRYSYVSVVVRDLVGHGVCASPPRAKDNSDQDQPKLSAGRSLSLYGPWIVASSKRRWFAPSASK
ncbi:hypothetical protein V6N13_104288 [Hibiscus sabdariffa]